MNRIVSKLEAHESKTSSYWCEAAEYRQANKSWLRHSQHIAVLMLDKMDELHLIRTKLAQRMGCSQQYVSKIPRGKENLSIEMLHEMEDALSLHLLPGEVEMAWWSYTHVTRSSTECWATKHACPQCLRTESGSLLEKIRDAF